MTCARPDRLEFLRSLGLGLAALGSADLLAGGCARTARPPNFVFILTDDHAHDALGCAGHPWIRTPGLDRVADEGVRFSNAFVTSSLCSPSRASFLSGLYPHQHGVCSNEVNDLPETVPTFPRLLQQQGYGTAFIGKWHMARTSRPRPGFDHWVSFNAQGDYLRNTLNVDGEWELSRRYVTDEITERGLAFLDRRRDGPFMLMLSHKAVHGPYTPAPRHAELYAEVPATMLRGDRRRRSPGRGGEPDPAAVRLDYARTLAAVDEGVAAVVEALERTGRLDDTVIVYAGDNGLMMGEREGDWDKRVAYEPSIRIPLLVRYPRAFAPGTVCDELALNVDVAPTLAQLAGVPDPPATAGLNLADLAAGARTRDAFLYEYFREVGPVPTTVALRTRRHKYITHPEDPELGDELYDLRYDPGEEFNRAGEEGYRSVREELAAELEAEKARTGFRIVKPVTR